MLINKGRLDFMQPIKPVFHKKTTAEKIKQAVELIKDADVLHISAGAGLGVDSGMTIRINPNERAGEEYVSFGWWSG